MKYLILLFTCLSLLSGCASVEEAYYLDREFGLASQAAWDKQIVHKDYRHASKTAETMEGITAEEVMDVHTNTYGDAPEDINVFQLGIE